MSLSNHPFHTDPLVDIVAFLLNPHTVTLPAHRGVLFGTHHDQADETVTLAPFEIMIVDVVA